MSDTWCLVSGPQPVHFILNIHSHTGGPWRGQVYRDRRKNGGHQGLEAGTGRCFLMGTEFQFRMMEKFWRQTGWWLHSSVTELNANESYTTLKNGENNKCYVYFTIYIFLKSVTTRKIYPAVHLSGLIYPYVVFQWLKFFFSNCRHNL